MTGQRNRGLRRGALALSAAMILAALFFWLRGGSRDAPAIEAESEALEREVAPAVAPVPAGPGALSGQVVGPDGRGMNGASVTAVQERGRRFGEGSPRVTTTGPDGAFRFDGLAPGRWLVAASAAGFTSAFRGQLEVEPGRTLEEVRLKLWSGGITLSGRVLDAGGGVIPGARVRSTGYDQTPAGTHEARAFQTEADGEGRYRLQLPKGHHRLQVDADGYAVLTESRELLGDQTRDFSLQPAARIAGRVVTGERREPVAGARVSAQKTGGWRDAMAEPAATSDELGRFRIEALLPGSYRLTARKPGLLGTFPRPITLDATDGVDDVELVVSETVTVQGRVISAAGRPVPHARVSSSPVGAGSHPFAPPPGGFSDETGFYRIEGLLPGNHRVVAWGNGYARQSAQLTISGDLRHDFVLQEAAVVTGVVLTAAGQPAPRAWVHGRVRSGREGGDTSSQVSADEQGRFTLGGLGGGQLTVTARYRLDAGSVGPEPLESGGRKQVTVRLGAAARIQGVVSWDDGSPAVGAMVMTVIGGDDGARSLHTEGRAADDGTFTIYGLPPGPVSLSVMSADGRLGDAWREWPPPGQATVTLQPGEHRTGVKLLLARK